MKYLFFPLFILFFCNVKVQGTDGIKFEAGLNWAQIKAKAKKENKYIFLDAYTTWCGPCREMARNIFPKKAVGDFFNQNFINVAVQFDVAKNDSKYVKSWHKEAESLHERYKIDSYPTYLFFTPDGNLVHFIKGASKDAEEFLAKAKQALEPKNQYLTLKTQYDAGKRDSLFLSNLISSAKLSGDIDSAPIFINEYLKTQKDLLTPRNLALIAQSTTKSTDVGFNVLVAYPGKIDANTFKGRSAGILKTIAFDEIVLPLIRKNGEKIHYGGGMIGYSGEIIKDVDWNVIKDKLDGKYSTLSQEIVVESKLRYYVASSDWGNFCKVVSIYASAKEKPDLDRLNVYANTILLGCDNLQYIDFAIKWSAQILSADKDNQPIYRQIYSCLLYKSGQTDKAINEMKEVIKLYGKSNDSALALLGKMEKGEKVW